MTLFPLSAGVTVSDQDCIKKSYDIVFISGAIPIVRSAGLALRQRGGREDCGHYSRFQQWQRPVPVLQADELHLRVGGDFALDTAAGHRRTRLPRHLAPPGAILAPTPHTRAASG